MRYELVWIDNGGSQEDHEHFLLRGAQFEVHHRNPTNEGLFRAVNDAWFRGRGCRAPYVLSLEDDRVARPDLATESSVQHLAYSMTLLRHDETLAGVRLKDEWSDEIIAAAAAAELGHPQPAITLPAVAIGAPSGTSSGVESATRRLTYVRHCMTLSSGFVWGSFSMAAVLYDRERLRSKVGFIMEGGAHDAMPYDYAEGQYAVRVGLANLCTARPHLVGACSTLDPDNEPLPQPPPSAYGSSHEEDRPCHQVFIERRPPRPRALNEFSWFFYDTELQAEGKQAEREQRPSSSKPSSSNPSSSHPSSSRFRSSRRP